MKETLVDRKRFLKLGAYALGAGAIIYGGYKMVDYLDSWKPRYVIKGNSPPLIEEPRPWVRPTNWGPSPKFKVYYVDGRTEKVIEP